MRRYGGEDQMGLNGGGGMEDRRGGLGNGGGTMKGFLKFK